MNYQEIKAKRQKNTDALLSECGVFFAFSDEQFHENKTPKEEGEKYVSIGSGGYMPKSKHPKLSQGLKDIENAFKTELKEAKEKDAHILYELNNHECFYTGNIDDAVNALGDGYTREDIQKVYYEHNRTQRLG
jgi:hypothetical protein